MRKSLLKQITYLIGIIFVASCIAFFTIANYSVKKARDVLVDESLNETIICANNIESRLSTLHEHIYTLAIDIYYSGNTNAADKELDVLNVKQICDQMDRKLVVSTDMDLIFMYDIYTNQHILRASDRINPFDVENIKGELFEYCIDHANASSNLAWTIVTINGVDYFYEAIHMGKYRVGCLSTTSNVVSKSDAFLGEDSALFIKYNDELYPAYGDQQLLDYVDDNYAGKSNKYIVSYAAKPACSVHVLSIMPSHVSIKDIEVVVYLLVMESIVIVFLIMFLSRFTDHQIRKPLESLLSANERLSKGDLTYHLNEGEADSEEFNNIYKSYNSMVDQISDLKIESYEMRLKEDENRLRMLRAQVRPHTFLNGFTTISNMTYTQKPEAIREYINAFARFTRYMLHTSSDMTTIASEMQHIKTYVDLQKKKSVVNIVLNASVEDEVKEAEIPFLLVYSLVENSVKHALVPTQDLMIYIKCSRYESDDFKGILIVEEDNGKGFDEEYLQKFSESLMNDDYTKEHLGLTNVKYTLRLLYQRSDLLSISNSGDGGARIEIRIPMKEGNHETVNM